LAAGIGRLLIKAQIAVPGLGRRLTGLRCKTVKPTVNNSYLAMNTYVQDYQGNYNGRRWSSRLVATAAEDRLSFRRNPYTSLAVSEQP
jgi:hypothetical protein